MDAHTKKMLGWESPDDKKVQVPQGHLNAQKLALWRSKVAWDIAVRQAEEIVDACDHDPECPALTSETGICLPGCRDREIRMSALVILNAARQFAPIDARQLAKMPYYAPSREQFSEVLGELAATQAELEAIRGSAVTVPAAEEFKELSASAAKVIREIKETP
jgi:hypothetical protein